MTTKQTEPDDDSLSAYARTGMVAPTGTLIDELKTKVDPDTAAKFRQIVHEAHTDTAGALRDWVYMLVHGKTYTDIQLESVKVKRDALFGTGPFEATLKAKP